MKKTLLVVGLFLSVSLFFSPFNFSVSSNTELQGLEKIVINEIDYDQDGGDTAEFVELKNTGSVAVNLDNYSVVFVNGASGTAVIYDTIDLPNAVLPVGGYFVICANAATVIDCDLDDAPNTDFIQNGAPDAVALRLSGTIVDTISYEGTTIAPYTETSGSLAADPATLSFYSVARYPDGTDTDDNSVDVTLRCATPGYPNFAQNSDCVAPQTPTAAFVTLGGRVTDANGRGLANAIIDVKAMDGALVGTARTGSFGYFTVEGLTAGNSYTVYVTSKRYTFPPQVVAMRENFDGLVIAANP